MTPSQQSPELSGAPPVSIEAIRARFDTACNALSPLTSLRSGEAVGVGCSGGGDSMALLDLAVYVARGRGWDVHVLHFDHAQRSSSSEEAQRVARYCAAIGVAFSSERMSGDNPAAGLDEGTLREARYDFFERRLKAVGADVLMLAHHADDRAETLLMRLMRGSGPTGLGSIRPVEAVGGMSVVRPLLEFRRGELRAYLEARGLDWIDDPSNLDRRFKRAWVRGELLPLMNERMGMDITPRLLRAGSLIEEEAAALRSASDLILKELGVAAEPPGIAALRLDHPLWREAAAELRRALLRAWLWKIRRGVHPPGFEAVQEALNFVERGSPAGRLRTVERIYLAKEAQRLVAYPESGGGKGGGAAR